MGTVLAPAPRYTAQGRARAAGTRQPGTAPGGGTAARPGLRRGGTTERARAPTRPGSSQGPSRFNGLPNPSPPQERALSARPPRRAPAAVSAAQSNASEPRLSLQPVSFSSAQRLVTSHHSGLPRVCVSSASLWSTAGRLGSSCSYWSSLELAWEAGRRGHRKQERRCCI